MVENRSQTAWRVPFIVMAMVAIVVAACSSTGSTSSPATSTATAMVEPSSTPAEAPSEAIEWPTDSVTIVVGAAPGTANDLTARTVADYISKKTGQTIIVDNQSGGSGADSMATLASQPADGTTVGLWSASLVNLLASKALPYTVDDYDFVAQTTSYPTLFCVKDDSPLTSVTDFVDKVKAGDKLTIGGPYTGSFVHLTVEQFAKAAGIDVTYVPFDGGPATDAAALGGHVDMVVSACRTEGLRHLAVTTPERTQYDPDTPTLKELGYDVSAAQWLGFVMKAGTDPAIVSRVEALIKEATTDPAFTDLAAKQKTDVDFLGSDEFTTQVTTAEQTAEALLAELGLN